MGESYNHLTMEDRIIIRTLLQEGKSKKYIADKLNRALSSIKREIDRNSGKRGYRPKQAHRKYEERKAGGKTTKMTLETVSYIEEKLQEEYSPEQISGRMKLDMGFKVSHEWIYQYVWKDKKEGGDLYRKLRIANGNRNRKRYGKKDYRGRIPGRVDIEDRPGIVNKKERVGDWEADLVSGVKHKGFLVTLVERKTKTTLIGKVMRKTSEEVTREIINMAAGMYGLIKTITYDNGREFSGHQKINDTLGCESYFAKPYHSWERGLNENTNGLIRQYFPKGTDLRETKREEIEFVQNKLNSRPRKTLDFRTPNEVLLEAG